MSLFLLQDLQISHIWPYCFYFMCPDAFSTHAYFPRWTRLAPASSLVVLTGPAGSVGVSLASGSGVNGVAIFCQRSRAGACPPR